jgi:tRNA G18 (ribose-2'-O)-methylase SpoU
MDGVPDPLDDFRALNDPPRRREVERRGGYFVVEGLHSIGELLTSPYRVRTILASDRMADRVRALVDGRAPVTVRPEPDVAAVAGFPFHRGALASADRRRLPDPDDLLVDRRFVAVVEGVGDHENVGALFRNAAAFGVDAVLLDPTTADPLYRRSVRVSLGHVLHVPWTRTAPLPGGLAAVRARGFEIVALTPAPGAEPIDALAADPPSGPVALLVGAEGPGLTAATLAAADRRVRIPLAPGVDSLNVATAAAVAFHRLAPPTA